MQPSWTVVLSYSANTAEEPSDVTPVDANGACECLSR